MVLSSKKSPDSQNLWHSVLFFFRQFNKLKWYETEYSDWLLRLKIEREVMVWHSLQCSLNLVFSHIEQTHHAVLFIFSPNYLFKFPLLTNIYRLPPPSLLEICFPSLRCRISAGSLPMSFSGMFLLHDTRQRRRGSLSSWASSRWVGVFQLFYSFTAVLINHCNTRYINTASQLANHHCQLDATAVLWCSARNNWSWVSSDRK